MNSPRKILITGSSGFIGFHLSKRLLAQGWDVLGYDNLNRYYDIELKHARLSQLETEPGFRQVTGDVTDAALLLKIVTEFSPDVIVHLAAQAGVRYSLEDPRSYVETNIVGSFNVLEAARLNPLSHLLMASTSSIYGANPKVPFEETDKADLPLTIYAASKKATEAMAHSYAHLWKIPTTLFRFFTVYGPWGRPDMAYYKFAEAILEGRPIDIYNHGKMDRDFTYIDDLIKSIALLIECPPLPLSERTITLVNDSLSPVAPHRIVNIGNSDRVQLMDFIVALEKALGVEAKKNFVEMQKGDVTTTWADTALLDALIQYRPATDYKAGVQKFADWYKTYRKT